MAFVMLLVAAFLAGGFSLAVWLDAGGLGSRLFPRALAWFNSLPNAMRALRVVTDLALIGAWTMLIGTFMGVLIPAENWLFGLLMLVGFGGTGFFIWWGRRRSA